MNRRQFIRRFLFAGAGLAMADAFWFEKVFIRKSEHVLGEKSDESELLTVIQISDTHLKSIGVAHRRLAKQVIASKPDIIVFTGDLVDNPNAYHLADQFLSLFPSAPSKFAILGNWEYWGRVDMRRLEEIYEKNRVKLLVNQSEQLRVGSKNILITGCDDFIGSNADYTAAVAGHTPADYHILITHCPQHRDQVVQECKTTLVPDIALSGHTHGGQIALLGFAPVTPQGSGRYVAGWYRDALPHLYVSRGIGTSILPVRFGARAEFSVFKIFV